MIYPALGKHLDLVSHAQASIIIILLGWVLDGAWDDLPKDHKMISSSACFLQGIYSPALNVCIKSRTSRIYFACSGVVQVEQPKVYK